MRAPTLLMLVLVCWTAHAAQDAGSNGNWRVSPSQSVNTGTPRYSRATGGRHQHRHTGGAVQQAPPARQLLMAAPGNASRGKHSNGGDALEAAKEALANLTVAHTVGTPRETALREALLEGYAPDAFPWVSDA